MQERGAARDGLTLVVGLFGGGVLVAASVFWHWQLSMVGQEAIYPWTEPLPVAVLLVALAVSIAVGLRRGAMLVAAPLAATAMVMPKLEGLPFIREFGYVLALASGLLVVARAALDEGTRVRLRRACSDPVVAILAAYFACGLISAVANFKTISDPASRVIVSHTLADLIVALFLISIFAAAELHRRQDELPPSAPAAGAIAVIGGVGALALPFFMYSELNPFAFLGTMYYCRLQLSFFGPVHYSVFVAASVPLMIHVWSRTTQGAWRIGLATAIWLAPIAVFAGGSRPARIALIAGLLIMGFQPRVRIMALVLAAFSAVLFAGLYQYRCLVDVVAYHYPALLPEGNRLPSGGTLTFEGFFQDTQRSWLRERALAPSSWSGETLLIGHGPGLAAYDQFDMGAHTSLIDVFVDRGLVGGLLLIAAMAALAARLVRMAMQGGDTGQFAVALLMSLLALVAGAVSFDVRNWLFVWLFTALAIIASRPSPIAEARAAPDFGGSPDTLGDIARRLG